ncbi:MAG TPA: site-2 protease family protein, partial [Rubrobacteraceae bacterium]|nr:site-2 protease family protein [Rubrobacteraceae bacterium]
MTILVAIVGLSALIVVHELGHLLAAKAMGVNVTEFGVGFGPPLLKKKVGKTLYSLRIILLGGFVKMAGMNDDEEGPESYNSKAAWRRALIIFAGPFANLLAAVLIFAVVFMGISPPTMEVETIMPESLAADVGLQEGDRIVTVDGRNVESWRQFQETVGDKRPGDEVELVVERDGELREYLGALTADERDPGRALVGVQPKASEENYGYLEALWLGVEQTGRLIGLFGWFLGQLATGEVDLYDSV